MPAPAAPPRHDHDTAPAGRLPAVVLMAGSRLPVLGAVLLVLALLAPFAGMIVDRLGRKRLLVVATGLYAVFGMAPLWLDFLHAILISRVLVGVAASGPACCCPRWSPGPCPYWNSPTAGGVVRGGVRTRWGSSRPASPRPPGRRPGRG